MYMQLNWGKLQRSFSSSVLPTKPVAPERQEKNNETNKQNVKKSLVLIEIKLKLKIGMANMQQTAQTINRLQQAWKIMKVSIAM